MSMGRRVCGSVTVSGVVGKMRVVHASQRGWLGDNCWNARFQWFESVVMLRCVRGIVEVGSAGSGVEGCWSA